MSQSALQEEKALKYVGQSVSRIDGIEKVSGAAVFVDDIEFGPDLLHAEIVESPYAHALIDNIDTTAAEKIPGVVKVVTAADFPFRFGLYMQDRYVFAKDRVRFVGEQVAAVVARDPKIAKRAAQLVKVTYRELKPILSPVDAAEEHAELIHPELSDYSHVPWFFPEEDSNIAHWRKTRKGDTDKAFSEADVVIEDTYTVPRYSHCAIEPHVIVGKLDYSGRLTLWSASQSPNTQRHVFAETLAPLGFSHKDVRVITPYIGGGFGGKAGVSMEMIGAALAIAVKGRPVKVRWRRDQEFYNTYQRQGVVATIKMGAKKDGTMTGLSYHLYWDAGAYVEYGANVVNAAGLSATGPYRIENVKIDSLCMYTNLPPGGPYRGFGYSEFHFGLESHIERMAKALGMDSIAFRKKNAIQAGDKLTYGATMNPSGLHQAIDKTVEALDWYADRKTENPNTVIGKGFSLFWKAPAMPPNAGSSAFMKFNEDGSLNILISGMDMGQGLLTVMAQIAAEVLTVPIEKIRVETPDTDRNAYEWQTVGSHVTWGCGNAVKAASEEMRDKIFDTVHRATTLNVADLYLEDESVKCRSDASYALPLKNFVINGIMMEDGTFRGGPILGSGKFMPEFSSVKSDPETSCGGKPNVHYTVGAAGAIVEIDKQTGKMIVRKIALAVDAGKAINPSNHQIYAATNNGLSIGTIDNNTHTIRWTTELAGQNISTIATNSAGTILYVGTMDNGIFVGNDKTQTQQFDWTHYTVENGLQTNLVTSIAVNNTTHIVYVGSATDYEHEILGGVSIGTLDLATHRITSFQHTLAGYSIQSIKTNSDGTMLLVGTFRNGLFMGQGSDNDWTHIDSSTPGFLIGNTIRDISISPDDKSFYVVGNGLAISHDAGLTWKTISANPESNVNAQWFMATTQDMQNLYVTTYAGIWASQDGGITWQQICPFMGKFPGTDIYVSPLENTIYYSTWDQGILANREHGVGNWTHYSTSTPGVDSNDINGLAATDHGKNIYAAVLYHGLAVSQNWGANWNLLASIQGLPGLDIDNVYANPISEKLYVGFKNSGLAVGTPVGDTLSWQTFSTAQGLASNAVWTSYANSSGQSIYVATNQGLSVSSDAGVHWTTYNANTPGFGSNDLTAVYANNDGKVIAVISGAGVSLSENSGTTWKTLNTQQGLPDTHSLGAMYTNQTGTKLYVTTLSGLAYTRLSD